MAESKTNEIKQIFKELGSKVVKVGWFSDNVYSDSGTPVAFIAYIMEYGGVRELKNGNKVVIPARAPMRINMERNGKSISATLGKAINAAMQTGDMDQNLNKFGLFVQGTLQDTIGSGLPPPNAESTIHGMLLLDRKTGEMKRAGSAAKENRKFGQGKGFDKPLIDTGRLMKTVAYTVE